MFRSAVKFFTYLNNCIDEFLYRWGDRRVSKSCERHRKSQGYYEVFEVVGGYVIWDRYNMFHGGIWCRDCNGVILDYLQKRDAENEAKLRQIAAEISDKWQVLRRSK